MKETVQALSKTCCQDENSVINICQIDEQT